MGGSTRDCSGTSMTAEARRETLARHFELFTRGHEEPDLKEEWLTLFTPDCVGEEPVGSEPRVGIMSIGWDMTHSDLRRLWLYPVLIIPSASTPECASVVRERLLIDGNETWMTAVGTWLFADDGPIAGSRIFIESGQMGPDAWDRLTS